MEVYIPSFRYEESELERGYTVRGGGAGDPRASGNAMWRRASGGRPGGQAATQVPA